MSSDLSQVTVVSVDGTHVVLRVRTGTAGGINDYSMTRSFVLTLLDDCARRASEEDERFRRQEPTPLQASLVEVGGELWYKKPFMEAHVGDYVVKTEVLERGNVREDNQASWEIVHAAIDAVKDAHELSPTEKEDRICETCHYIVLRAEMTDAKWLEGIEAGMVFGSTAFDAWWDDPLRPPLLR